MQEVSIIHILENSSLYFPPDHVFWTVDRLREGYFETGSYDATMLEGALGSLTERVRLIPIDLHDSPERRVEKIRLHALRLLEVPDIVA